MIIKKVQKSLRKLCAWLEENVEEEEEDDLIEVVEWNKNKSLQHKISEKKIRN